MNILSLIKNRKPYPRPAPLSEAKKRQRAKEMAQGKRAQLKRKKSKPTSTAREKAIASRAVKPKAKRLIINKHNPHINRSKQRGR
jgi:hypothetical protein